MKQQFLVLVFLVSGGLAGSGLAAQDQVLTFDHRVAGDRVMTIQMGPMLPLAIQKLTGALAPANLTPGGTLGFAVDVYLNDTFRLGGGLRGSAAFGPNGRTLFMVPLLFRSTWELKTFPWSFPVGMTAGGVFTSYRDETHFDAFLAPTAGAYWNWNPSWLFPSATTPPITDSRLAHFLDLTAGAVYHF